MRRILFGMAMLISMPLLAQTTPPVGWERLPGSTVEYFEPRVLIHSNVQTKQVYRFDIWSWSASYGYVKFTIGCSYDSYAVYKDNKPLADNLPLNPGISYWYLRNKWCS
jgi:hypothetical protein